jgi:hypothetical protein
VDGQFDEQAVMPDAVALEELNAVIVQYNEIRPKMQGEQTLRIAIWLGVYGVFAGGLLWLLYSEGQTEVLAWAAPLACLAAIGIWHQAQRPSRHFQQQLRDWMLPRIFGFVKDVQYSFGGVPKFVKTMPRDAFLPRGQETYHDILTGRIDGLSFTLLETVITEGIGSSKKTLFAGVIFHFLRENRFPGLLLASRKPNAFVRFFRDMFSNSLTLIESGHTGVDETHEFRSDNRAAATPIVQRELVKALDYLARVWPDDVVRIAFADAHCYLLVPSRKNFFELPDISIDLDYRQHVEPMIRDLVTLLATARLVSRIGTADG